MIGRSSSFLFAMFFCADGVALAAKAPLNTSLCAADEQVYFSCRVANGSKRIALCGQVKEPTDGEGSFLQYRFGERGNPEMVFPSAWEASLDKFSYSGAYSKMGRTGSEEVSFHRGNFDYTVYMMFYPLGDAESSGYAHMAGVRVARDGQDVANVKCGGTPQAALGELSWLRYVCRDV